MYDFHILNFNKIKKIVSGIGIACRTHQILNSILISRKKSIFRDQKNLHLSNVQ